MGITERQKGILDRIVQEYIDSAQPVSSQFLEKKYNFGICPATIRIEMQKLTDRGFLHQPHTSAGRIPTDKGYRFYVNDLAESDFGDEFFFDEFKELEKKIEDLFKFTQSLTKSLASASSNLALSYLLEKDFLWKEGWGEILREPEFRDLDFYSRFIEMVDNFEKEIESFFQEDTLKLKIYIGKENPLPKSRDFSIIISKCHFPKEQKGVLAILGPKRMAYDRNISLINSLIKALENF